MGRIGALDLGNCGGEPIMHQPYRRRRYLVDQDAQGALLRRAARYWVNSILCIAGFTVLGWLFIWPGIPTVVGQWELLSPMLSVLAVGLVVSLLVMPLVLYDFLKLTNRFAGPVYRLERSLRDLAAGRQVKPVRLRDGDYCNGLADAFNLALERQRLLEERLAASQSTAEPDASVDDAYAPSPS